MSSNTRDIEGGSGDDHEDGVGRNHSGRRNVVKEVAQPPKGKIAPPPPSGPSPDENDCRNPESIPDAVTWTRELELSADLAAHVKAEILRQGAGRRQLRFKRRDVAASEIFFRANQMWMPAHLLRLWRTCGRLDEASGGWDRLWHARRGKDFKFLLLNLDEVVHQLGVVAKVPPLVVVEPEKLYKLRRPRNRKSGKAGQR